LRKTVIRSSNVLLTLAGIGILTIILGILYFSGAGGVEGTDFYGFDYSILLAFGFYLSLIGLFPVLSSLDAGGKDTVRKLNIHLFLLTGIGIILLIYSVLVPDTLAPLAPSHKWSDYFVLGAVLVVFGLSPILLGIHNRERLWSLKIIYFLIFLIGILFEIASILTYFEFLESFDIGKSMWITFYLYGGIIVFIGLLPLLVGASPNFRAILHKLRIIWILIALIGIILYIAPTLALNEILPMTVFDIMGYLDFLAFGGMIIVISLLLISASDQAYDFIYKLRYIMLLLLLAGIIQLIISFILVLPNSEYIDIPELESIVTISTFPGKNGWYMLLGMTWDIFFVNGTIMTFIGIVFICSIVFFESEKISGDIGVLVTGEVDKLPGIDATASEMAAYLEIVSKTQEDMINYFKEAVRQDRFRPRVFEALTKQYQDQNKLIKAKLTEYQKKAPISAKSLFDEVLSGKPPEAAPPTPPPAAPSVAPPTPPPTAPSVAPPTPPPAAPSVAPPTPPLPTPRTPTPPPAPSAVPSPPGQSPLDLIADARSTSIAELRGEMLKELRRLREIFKEE
jgi:hypothetical protein